jgi:hypothetical protein
MEVLIPGRAPANRPQSPPRHIARIFCGRRTVAKACTYCSNISITLDGY